MIASLSGMSVGVALLAFSPSPALLAVYAALLVPLALHSTLNSLGALQVLYLCSCHTARSIRMHIEPSLYRSWHTCIHMVLKCKFACLHAHYLPMHLSAFRFSLFGAAARLRR